MKRNVLVSGLVLLVGVLMIVACSGQKGPAETAIKAAEDALNASRAEAAKYVPDQVKSLEETLAAAKGKFAAKDYKGALADATALVEQAKGLPDAMKAKKEELTAAWKDLSNGLPKMVEAIQSRVTILSKAKKLPNNLTKEGFEEVKSGLASAKEEWTKAQQSFTSGNIAEAVSAAKSVKEKAVKAMETLGLPAPGGSAT